MRCLLVNFGSGCEFCDEQPGTKKNTKHSDASCKNRIISMRFYQANVVARQERRAQPPNTYYKPPSKTVRKVQRELNREAQQNRHSEKSEQRLDLQTLAACGLFQHLAFGSGFFFLRFFFLHFDFARSLERRAIARDEVGGRGGKLQRATAIERFDFFFGRFALRQNLVAIMQALVGNVQRFGNFEQGVRLMLNCEFGFHLDLLCGGSTPSPPGREAVTIAHYTLSSRSRYLQVAVSRNNLIKIVQIDCKVWLK